MTRAAEPPATHVVAIVGSAGGIRAVQSVLGALPVGLDACVVVVIHLTPLAPSLLHSILDRATTLHVAQAFHGALLEPGVVWVAPPDAHLLVEPDETLRLDHSELVHHVRPSADVLLLSMARNHEGPCTAVVLSGTGIDGAAGAAAVKQAGGRVLAQDEATSQYFGMPGAAILAGGVDEILPLDEIASAVLESTMVAQ
ncbi:MAG TPA: chemotaxis protein CheB [Gaiellaceae bacterium]|nr:chemotaxis protein CheB [Gaiellaceae bacterium]